MSNGACGAMRAIAAILVTLGLIAFVSSIASKADIWQGLSILGLSIFVCAALAFMAAAGDYMRLKLEKEGLWRQPEKPTEKKD